ncbi:MAG: hypothetical protein COC01_04150 [Bacteroidetes bacterium]|nr:MAG: hypothetical protein COC01_04150 [Bacteroidota bacterium]
MGLSFQNIGTIYHEQTKYSLALEHYKKALIIFEKYRDKHKIAVTSSNIGAVYANIGENELANTYYIKSLEIKKELGDKVGQAYTFNNIGKSYAMQDKNEKAIEFHMKALNIQMSISDKSGESFSLMSIGNLNFKQGEITLALEYLKRSLKLSLEIGAKKEVQLSYRSISLIYDRINDYQNAYKYHKLYTGTKDSLFNETSSKQLTEMQTKYETEKKENEINLLTKEKEIQDLEINKNKTVQVALISVLVLVSLLGFLIHNRYRIKTKSNELLSEKNNELEQSREEIRAQNVELGQINQLLDNKNKNITNSINYAQRIQETIMPTKKNLERIFPESFIFFKAKDVVSGDFPFIAQVGDDIFVSAVDCTGHGVPEAMMSMIGYFLLNDIINGRNILQPDVILNELHKGVLATLNQKENLESRDGMDIAFCKINTKKMTVDYAGAHRPLLVSNNGDLKEIRGDRFPIGGTFYSSRGKDIKFTNHSISLNRGDTILLYSDGLPDQQGGSKEKSKSFGNRQIKKIVTENKNKKMADMHKIFQERFDVWCGKGNQLDDVLLIGIRMT